MRRLLICTAVVALLAGTAAVAQETDEIPADIRRMVDGGKGEALERKLGGGKSIGDLELIARAYANQGRRAKKTDDREAAYEKSAEIHQKWIDEASKPSLFSPDKRIVDIVAARVAFGGMILSGWASSDLDQYEITAGLKGDRERLLRKLRIAREQYDHGWETLAPLADDLAAREDEFIALGIYDRIKMLRLDLILNRAWTNYYLGVRELEADDRERALGHARDGFRELLDSAYAGRMVYMCYLGYGMTLRELDRYDEALEAFGNIADDDADLPLRLQMAYEVARTHMDAGRFEEAREALKPLLEKDVDDLTPEERPAMFYFNLARLREAQSYLLEGEALREQAEGSRSAAVLRRNADERRARGLSRLSRLADRGGSWPAIVQIYVASSVDRRADPKTLTATELLYAAKAFSAAGENEKALTWLREAAGRTDSDPRLAGDVLFELGRTEYTRDHLRAAAETFDRLAGEYKSHAQAEQAATYAYQLWAKLAEDSAKPGDYDRLADTLLNLLQSFPKHPKRREASWFLPVALQNAGRLDEAVQQFGLVPENSSHWEEAQFRRALCARLAVEQKRGELDEAAYKERGKRAAEMLRKYAGEAIARAAETGKDDIRGWGAQAMVNAAELLVSQGVGEYAGGLDVLKTFEADYPDSGLMGRVLGARIKAYRGQRDFARAAEILEQYLASVPADRAGAVLANLAAGMQEEVERLNAAGDAEATRELAGEAVATFEQLEKWVAADATRAKSGAVVKLGLARMLFFAERYDEAEPIVGQLLAAAPRNGNYQRLYARLLTARLKDDSPVEAVKAAEQAWGKLLTDTGLVKRAPERYWEARYNWLALRLRGGEAAEVHKAIGQEEVWRPDLGGPEWKAKLDDLKTRAADAVGIVDEKADAGDE